MFAVIRTGGKQYRVAENDRIVVERLAAEPGATVAINDVLMIAGGDGVPTVGAPLVSNAAVYAEVVEQTRGEKILVFKKQRRKKYRRTKGHRQDLTVLRITGISADGKKPKASKPAKAATKPTEEAAPVTAEDAPVEAPAVPEPTAVEPPAVDPAADASATATETTSPATETEVADTPAETETPPADETVRKED